MHILQNTAPIFFFFPFLGSPAQCPNRRSGWKMKIPVFLEAAPGMSLGKEFDALCKRLELSNAVKVKTHQFFSKFHHVLDSSVCGRGERDMETACRIRPLGVTVLSRIHPAPSHKHSLTVTKWCHVRASIVQERWV